MTIDDRSTVIAKAEALKETCAICQAPATCIGAYEGGTLNFACDTCCGHGCEDGRCWPLGELSPLFTGALADLLAQYARDQQEIAALKKALVEAGK